MQELIVATFILGAEEYGVEVNKVQEIIRVPQNRSKLPNTTDHDLGITNLRGHIIPIIDLKRKFLKVATEFTDESRVMVVESNSQKVGIVVDEVLEVIKFPAEEVVPPDSLNAGIEAGYLLGIVKHGERLLILLEADKILQ